MREPRGPPNGATGHFSPLRVTMSSTGTRSQFGPLDTGSRTSRLTGCFCNGLVHYRNRHHATIS
jgi:hypothetical protein